MAKTKKVAVKPETRHSLRLEWRSPAELAENPRNWRTHPEDQIAALTDVIGEVGWAGACLFNERTGRLIDGHARRKVAIEQGTERVPVLVGDWSEEQEATILASLDPLAAMAEADAGKLDALLAEVNTDSAALQTMLDGLREAVPEIEATDEWPAIEKTTTHTITLRYGPGDEETIKRFVGQQGSGPLDPIQTGKRILERLKAIVVSEADCERNGESAA